MYSRRGPETAAPECRRRAYALFVVSKIRAANPRATEPPSDHSLTQGLWLAGLLRHSQIVLLNLDLPAPENF